MGCILQKIWCLCGRPINNLCDVSMIKFVFLNIILLTSSIASAITMGDLEFGTLRINATLKDIKAEHGDPLAYNINNNKNLISWPPSYLYKSFNIYLKKNINNTVDKITAIEILESNISTKGGIRIGDTLEDVKRIYGDIHLQDYFVSTGTYDFYYHNFTHAGYYRAYGPDEHLPDGYGTKAILVFFFRDNTVVRILAHEVSR